MAAEASVIDPSLLESLETKERTTVIVSFKGDTEEVLKGIEARTFPTRDARATAVHDELSAYAAGSQGPVLEFLRTKATDLPDMTFQSMWINNSLVIKNAGKALVQELTKFEQIKRIKEDSVVAHIHS
jgi:hypothetical protein